MKTPLRESTGRIEAFSDGVIAIIITVMVFDLKLLSVPTADNLGAEMLKLLPKAVSYLVSFMMIGVMWVNHHQLFHQVRHGDRRLLWYNLLLLFWMSLIPFGTNLIGANPMLWQASSLYAMVFFMCALAFMLLRGYVVKREMLHDGIQRRAHERVQRKNRITLGIYLGAAALAPVSVFIAFGLFLLVPLMYFMPQPIVHETES